MHVDDPTQSESRSHESRYDRSTGTSVRVRRLCFDYNTVTTRAVENVRALGDTTDDGPRARDPRRGGSQRARSSGTATILASSVSSANGAP